MIKLVVFDMAGTTIHDGDAVNACFRATLDSAGIAAAPELVNTVMGLPKPEAIRLLLAATGNHARMDEVHALHESFSQRMRDYYKTDSAVCAIPGAADAFAALRQMNIKVALNTGFDRPIADVLLGRLGWCSPAVTDADVTSDEVPRGRPYPDMIRHLMTRLGVSDARHVAKVGDTSVDLEEGANAGCGLVIGVTSGSYTRAQLQAYPHSYILNSVAEIPLLLRHYLGSSASCS